ncbi:MAG: SDR family oxidoreductase, partial [Robiginitomaculum sp.]
FVQISAPDAQASSKHVFYSTKAAGDSHVKRSGLDWMIMRPGLVIGRAAYGGTHLLRAMASFPSVQPVIFSKKRVQTVALTDVALVACDGAEGKISSGSDFDVLEDDSHSFGEILALYRKWLGIAPARFEINIPLWMARIGAKAADGLAWLGWRLPFRTTSLRVMEDNVLGDSAKFKTVSTRKLRTFAETLAAMPASNVERFHARISLFLPLLLITLSGFWLASGIIGLLHVKQAIAVLPETMDAHMARAFVLTGSGVDIGLGLLIWLRKWTRAACLGMGFVTAIYLVSATFITPHLWADPMGPLVKSIPAMALALFTSFFLEER